MNTLRMILARIEPYIAKRMTPLKDIFRIHKRCRNGHVKGMVTLRECSRGGGEP